MRLPTVFREQGMADGWEEEEQGCVEVYDQSTPETAPRIVLAEFSPDMDLPSGARERFRKDCVKRQVVIRRVVSHLIVVADIPHRT